MFNSWWKKIEILGKSSFPAILLLILTSVYIGFDNYFVRCNGDNNRDCEKIQSDLISQVDEPTNLAIAAIELSNKVRRFNDKKISVREKEDEIVEKQKEITSKLFEIGKTIDAKPSANISILESQKSQLDTNVTLKQIQLKGLNDDKDKAEKELINARKEISSRYSNRMLWVFLTAIFLIICAVAIVFSGYVMLEPMENFYFWQKWREKSGSWRLAWVLVIINIAFSFANYAFSQAKHYMSIVTPLFDQSINKYGDLKIDVVNFFNVFGFAAIIFLVGASCSIFYKVEEIKLSGVPDKTVEFDKYRKYIRTILYIGSAMLFVGIYRVKVISEWHLAFVSSGQNDAFVNLLRSFLSSSITVQASFYTILLAVIYLPVANRIPDSPEVGKTYQDDGLLASIKEFTPRFIMLLSPFLAQPIADIFKNFFANS